MDAVELLIHQHREIEAKFKEVLETADKAQRGALAAAASDELTTHILSEEQIFFPAVRAKRTEDILLESLEEHLSLKRLLADLNELDPSAQTFEPKVKVLYEQAEHHHKEEEESLFPKVMKLLDPVDRSALGDQMLAMQQRLQRQGEPRDVVEQQTERAAPLR